MSGSPKRSTVRLSPQQLERIRAEENARRAEVERVARERFLMQQRVLDDARGPIIALLATCHARYSDAALGPDSQYLGPDFDTWLARIGTLRRRSLMR